METLIVIFIVILAAAYVGYTFYRQYKGKGGCSSGCSCTPEIKHYCNGMPDSLNPDQFNNK